MGSKQLVRDEQFRSIALEKLEYNPLIIIKNPFLHQLMFDLKSFNKIRKIEAHQHEA